MQLKPGRETRMETKRKAEALQGPRKRQVKDRAVLSPWFPPL